MAKPYGAIFKATVGLSFFILHRYLRPVLEFSCVCADALPIERPVSTRVAVMSKIMNNKMLLPFLRVIYNHARLINPMNESSHERCNFG
jgi:hypothetical protein